MRYTNYLKAFSKGKPMKEMVNCGYVLTPKIGDQLLALPLFKAAIGLTSLRKIIRPVDFLPDQLVVVGRLMRLARFIGFGKSAQGGWLVVDMRILAGSHVHMVGHLPITLIGGDMLFRRIDRDLQIVGPDAIALRIRVGEGAALQQLVVGKVQSVDEHAGPEGSLLYFGKIVFRIFVEHQFANRQEGELVGWPELRRIDRVEVELGVFIVAHDLHTELPFRIISAFDRIVQILGRVAVVELLHFIRFGLLEVFDPLLQRLKMVLDKHRFPVLIHPFASIDTRALHLAVIGGYTPWRKDKRNHMGGFRRLQQEVTHPLRIIHIGDRIRTEGMHHVGKFQRIADKEDLQVVPVQIPVAVLGIKFDGKATGVSQCFR